jgi:hypothetical protein
LGDVVVIPALTLVEQDRHRGNLDLGKQKLIFQNLRMLIEDVAERSEELIAGNKERKTPGDEAPPVVQKLRAGDDTAVVCVPARDEADEIAALMIERILDRRGISVKVISCAALAGECVEEMKHIHAGVACVAVVPPFGQMNARYMCRRLRAQFPDLKLIAAILTERPADEIKTRGPAIIADETATSLKQTVNAVLSYLPTSEEVKEAA